METLNNPLFRLEGNWTFNPTLSELLSGDSNAGGFLGQMIVGFSNQSEVNILDSSFYDRFPYRQVLFVLKIISGVLKKA